MSKRNRLTLGEKRQICVFSEENPMTTHPPQPDFIELQPVGQIPTTSSVSQLQSPIESVNNVQMYETPSPYYVSPTRNLNTLHPCRLFRPYSDNNLLQ